MYSSFPHSTVSSLRYDLIFLGPLLPFPCDCLLQSRSHLDTQTKLGTIQTKYLSIHSPPGCPSSSWRVCALGDSSGFMSYSLNSPWRLPDICLGLPGMLAVPPVTGLPGILWLDSFWSFKWMQCPWFSSQYQLKSPHEAGTFFPPWFTFF